MLDIGAVAVCLKDSELRPWLQNHKPDLVVTDSQAFAYVSSVVPKEIPLTSFSILFSRMKGDFEAFLKGTRTIDNLKDGDKILIMESCSHSVNKCDDIGRTKIPALMRKYTGKQLDFDVLPNLDPIPQDAAKYKLAVQCGGVYGNAQPNFAPAGCIAKSRGGRNQLRYDAGLLQRHI